MAMFSHEDGPLPSVRFQGDDPAAPALPCSTFRNPSRKNRNAARGVSCCGTFVPGH